MNTQTGAHEMALSTDKVNTVQVRLSNADLERLKALAAKENIAVSEWIRRTINNG